MRMDENGCGWMDSGYDRMVLNGTDSERADEGSFIILETVEHGQILNESTQTIIDRENIGDKVLHEDAEYTDKAGNLLIDEAILEHHHPGHILLNGTDGSSTNAGGKISWDEGTFESIIGTYAAFIPPGGAAETYDALRTTFDNTSQTYDVLEGA